MAFELKRLPRASLDAALAKAEHYRDLNQPEEAESICRDVLDVDAEQPARAGSSSGSRSPTASRPGRSGCSRRPSRRSST